LEVVAAAWDWVAAVGWGGAVAQSMGNRYHEKSDWRNGKKSLELQSMAMLGNWWESRRSSYRGEYIRMLQMGKNISSWSPRAVCLSAEQSAEMDDWGAAVGWGLAESMVTVWEWAEVEAAVMGWAESAEMGWGWASAALAAGLAATALVSRSR
jgi:hypothetical protein